ncbi:hypothetical protein LCGC14_2287810 [marine sediment metagenome]|uniref:Uncharacterized protein n=1 Tax=marine sediment metagenome TaxID=412755 RepID=A0A0F9CSN1_9ZZZZ
MIRPTQKLVNRFTPGQSRRRLKRLERRADLDFVGTEIVRPYPKLTKVVPDILSYFKNLLGLNPPKDNDTPTLKDAFKKEA